MFLNDFLIIELYQKYLKENLQKSGYVLSLLKKEFI